MRNPFFKMIVNLLLLVFILVVGLAILALITGKQTQSKPSQNLSQADFKDRKNEYLELLKQEDPKVALTKLQKDIEADSSLARSCHTLVHELGRAAFTKYHTFNGAIRYQNELCNSGYFHGVIEAYFTYDPSVLNNLNTACNQYQKESFHYWQCNHGIGHGVMFLTQNDLPRSLKLCNSLQGEFKIENCVNGVFMENFNTDQVLHPSKFLSKSDPFYPCGEMATNYKKECYTYAPTYFLSLHRNEYNEALNWCERAEDSYILSCIWGVGNQVMKDNINNVKYVEDVCNKNTGKRADYCMAGAIDLYINNSGSVEPAKKICSQLRESSRKICKQVIKSKELTFTN